MAETDVLTIKDYLPLAGVLVGGILAIVGGFLSTLWAEFIRERKLRRALALAFQGEIGALLEIIEKRQYIAGLKKARAQTKATGETQGYSFWARRKYFSVFEANVGQIGLLKPPLSELAARFYTQANSILEDMERFEGIDPGTVAPDVAIAAYDQLIMIFEDLVTIGDRFVEEVSRLYS